METIVNADEIVLNILGKRQESGSGYRMMKYCVSLEVEEGVLLFNVLTRELLLLTQEEYDKRYEFENLKNRWFIVPEHLNEKEYVGLVRWTLKHMQEREKEITKYTIMTTTDCNARCCYCYEHGCKKVTMTEETAHKVAGFIKEHCGDKPVRINWFGGEPLVNASVIDIISGDLYEEGISFQSAMISNAYLFQEQIIERAVNQWNLKSVQVTIDGTEEIYNRSKAFVNPEGSPYQIVLSNIRNLLAAGIRVAVRLNLDMTNGENLLLLVDELNDHFVGSKGLRAYVQFIFDTEKNMTELYSEEELEKLYHMAEQLEEKLSQYGLLVHDKNGIVRKLRVTQCMADNDSATLITPEGYLGMCEHYPDSERMGHVDCPERDQKMMESWKAEKEEIPECGDCVCYPECIRLKKCNTYGDCFDLERKRKEDRIMRAMRNELTAWKNRQSR